MYSPLPAYLRFAFACFMGVIAVQFSFVWALLYFVPSRCASTDKDRSMPRRSFTALERIVRQRSTRYCTVVLIVATTPNNFFVCLVCQQKGEGA